MSFAGSGRVPRFARMVQDIVSKDPQLQVYGDGSGTDRIRFLAHATRVESVRGIECFRVLVYPSAMPPA